MCQVEMLVVDRHQMATCPRRGRRSIEKVRRGDGIQRKRVGEHIDRCWDCVIGHWGGPGSAPTPGGHILTEQV